MNINDFTRLYESISNNSKCHNFNNTLDFFDFAIFKKLKSNKVFPSKKFLLECLTPEGIKYLVENYSLEMSEISIIAKHIINTLQKDFPSEEVESGVFSILDKQIEKAIVNMDEKDLCSISFNHVFEKYIISHLDNLALSGVRLSHLTKLSFPGIKYLNNKGFIRYQNIIMMNMLHDTTKFSDEEIKEFYQNEDLSDLCYALNYWGADAYKNNFMGEILFSALWEKMTSSNEYLRFFEAIIDSESNKNKLKGVLALLSRWYPEMIVQYKSNPSAIWEKLIVAGAPSDVEFDEIINAGVNITLSNYLNYVRQFTGVIGDKTFDNLLNEPTSDVLSFLGEKILHQNLPSFFQSDADGLFVNTNKIRNPIISLNSTGLVLFTLDKSSYDDAIKEKIKSLFYEKIVDDLNYLDVNKSSFSYFVPTLDKYNNLYQKSFIGFLMMWQENNPQTHLIDWSRIYVDVYHLSSEDIKALGDEFMRKFSVTCIRSILSSPNGSILTLNLSRENNEGDDSIKWISYSPDSPVLEGFFKEHTNNNSILFAKLVLREGIDIAKESDLLPEVVWRLAFNHRSYKETLASLFPMFDFNSMSMGTMKEPYVDKNLFAVNIFEADINLKKIISELPISYDMTEDYCEDASDDQLLEYLKNANAKYLSEAFLEEVYDRGMHLEDSNVYDLLFFRAESILSLKLVDNWRKETFESVARKHVKTGVSTLTPTFVWDRLFQCFTIRELALKNNDEKYFSHLKEKEDALKSELLKVSSSSSVFDNFNFDRDFIGKTRFKRTVSMMSYPLMSSIIYELMAGKLKVLNRAVFEKNEGFIKILEGSHPTINESFMNHLVYEIKNHNDVDAKFMENLAIFLVKMIDSFPVDLVNTYLPGIIETYPELIYNDNFNTPETEKYIGDLSFEDILIYTEKAIIRGNLLAQEFVCRKFFEDKFQKAVYFPSTQNSELFKKYPVAFAFLNLLPPLSYQKATFNGWSLALSSSNTGVFLSGLKTIINRIVELSNSDNFILLDSLVTALNAGGVTFDLIKKPLLCFIRDHHLYLYMFFLNKMDDADSWSDFESRFVFSNFEKSMNMFEEFAFSLTTDSKSGKRKNIVPLEEIYKDINISPAYNILYYVVSSLKSTSGEVIFMVNKILSFIQNYPTVYKDLYINSSYPYFLNMELNKNFFIAISSDRLESIVHKKILENSLNKVESSDNSVKETDFFKL